jgi:hypothetical protein
MALQIYLLEIGRREVPSDNYLLVYAFVPENSNFVEARMMLD